MKAKKPCCPKCASRQIQYLKRNKQFWCRVCGNEFMTPAYQDETARTK